MATSDSASRDSSGRSLGGSTLAVHAGEDRQKFGHSLTDPVFCSATYTFRDTQAVVDFNRDHQPREEYGRYGSPNEKVVERKLAVLEGGQQAVIFASGMAAFAGILLSKLSAGDEIVFFDECYHRCREFCFKHLSRFGVRSTQVTTSDYAAMEGAITPRTRMLIAESPTNPQLSVLDMPRFAGLGRRRGVPTLVDATLATPYNVRPLEHGVDFVLHAATKYLAGHNDLLAGVIIGSDDGLADVRQFRGITGPINSPQNLYLLQRGLKTLELRMERHNANGQAVAEFLSGHPRVERVYYPGLDSHRDYRLARAQMRGFGGLVTFLVRDADWQATGRVVDRVQIPRIGPSLGGVESLIEQPLVMSYLEYSAEERKAFGISDNMIRLSCGIENAEDLIADLKQALDTE